MKQKDYPRIYSLSTIGIRSHYDCNYIFHPFRTDFAGDSGVGKSVVADILQLIFVGEDEFEPATESTEERTVKGLAINKHGYVFLNVEVDPNQYLVFGMYIGSTVEPFILQEGYSWDTPTYLRQPFSYDQLIFNGTVYDIDEAINRLKDYHCEKFPIKKYHEYLYEYKILPLDLRSSLNLRNYAQILRSLSRGKGFSLNTENLKKFFFGEEQVNEIYEEFGQNLSGLKKDLTNYEKDKKSLDEAKIKEKRLFELKEKKDEQEKAEKEFCISQCIFYHQNIANLNKEIGNLKNQITQETTKVSLLNKILKEKEEEDLKKEMSDIEDKIKRYNIIRKEIQDAENDILSYHNKQELAKQKYPNLIDDFSKVETVDKWLIAYNDDYEALKQAHAEQHKNKEHRSQLQNITSILKHEDLWALFQDFEFQKNSSIAKAKMDEQKESLIEEISQLSALKKISDIHNSKTLGHWVINNIGCLTQEQESLLLHFQDLPKEKPSNYKSKSRYLPFPEKLFLKPELLEKTEKGFWIEYKGIREFVEYVHHQLFDKGSKQEIVDLFEQMHADAEENIQEFAATLEQTKKLEQLLNQIGLGNVELFEKKTEIEKFNQDKDLLKVSPTDFETYVQIYFNADEIKSLYKELKEYEDLSKIAEGIKSAHKHSITEFANYLVSQGYSVIANNTDKISQEFTNLLLAKQRAVETKNQEIKTYSKPINNLVSTEIENNFRRMNLTQLQECISSKNTDIDRKKQNIFENETKLESETRNCTQAELNYEALFVNQKFDIVNYEEKDIDLNEIKNNWSVKKGLYESKYAELVNGFVDESIKEIINESLDFRKLAKTILNDVLADKLLTSDADVFEQLTTYITRLTEKNLQFSELKIKILRSILKKIKQTYNEFAGIIDDINKFLRSDDKRISQGYTMNLVWEKSARFSMAWIDEFLRNFEESINHIGLFEVLSSHTNITDMMVKAYTECGGFSSNVSLRQLLNPLLYFDIRCPMTNDFGDKNIGSTGQTYAAIALLCLARLSVVTKTNHHTNPKGLRYMSIDEAEGIGSNYPMLAKIAEKFDYQIITQSIEPLDQDEEGAQYLYILTGNSPRNEKIGTFAVFNDEVGLQDYNQTI
jgi:hypothetical protein